MQFIWLYITDEAKGDELRYSMRSVRKYFTGHADIVLVGDAPEWYCGRHIHIPRIAAPTMHGKFHALLDQSHKLYTVLQHADIADSFVIMMDDHYFLRDFTLADIQVPRCAPGWQPKNRYWWDIAITLTMQELERRGMSTHLFETHLMHVFEKDKLQYIFDRFSLCKKPLLRNTLYGNTFRQVPKDCRPFITAPQTCQTAIQLDKITKRSVVLNHASGVWDSSLRDWLQQRLPDVCSHESLCDSSILSG